MDLDFNVFIGFLINKRNFELWSKKRIFFLSCIFIRLYLIARNAFISRKMNESFKICVQNLIRYEIFKHFCSWLNFLWRFKENHSEEMQISGLPPWPIESKTLTKLTPLLTWIFRYVFVFQNPDRYVFVTVNASKMGFVNETFRFVFVNVPTPSVKSH